MNPGELKEGPLMAFERRFKGFLKALEGLLKALKGL
jgi:hypothetical protein